MKLTFRTLLAGFGLLIALEMAAWSQVGPQMRSIRTASGLTLINEVPGGYFRMLIRGANVARVRTPKRYWYQVDGVRFEFFSEENSNFVMTDVPIMLPDRTVLNLYQSDFLRRNAAEQPRITSSWITLANGKTALFWTSTRWPAALVPTVEKQMYIALATPTRIYALLTTIKDGQSESAVRAVLTRTLGSLVLSDEPFPQQKIEPITYN
jgi:hypothetical protein